MIRIKRNFKSVALTQQIINQLNSQDVNDLDIYAFLLTDWMYISLDSSLEANDGVYEG